MIKLFEDENLPAPKQPEAPKNKANSPIIRPQRAHGAGSRDDVQLDRKKIGFALVGVLLGLAAGIYLSGFLVLLFLKLDTNAAGLQTYYSYFSALDMAQVRPYAGRVKLAGCVGFGLPLLACLTLLVLILKPAKKSLHGDARFAHAGDLAKKGMFKASDTGIVVGKFNGKLVRLGGQQFVILAAPTRSGKGVGVVVPNLLDYRESVVVLDIKQENFELTSGWRASQGQKIYLFNPFAEDLRTHRWNPLTYVSSDPAFRVSDLMSIAAMLYPDVADDQKFWVSQARNAFIAFSLYLFENWEDMNIMGFPGGYGAPTLGAIYRLSTGDGTELKAYLQALSKKPFLTGNARAAFANLLSQVEETFASIMGTFKEPLNAWINPVLDAATGADDFLLTDLRKKKMTIYVGIQPNKLAESRLIVNLFFSQIINLNTRELPQGNPALKYQCLLLMDEFTSIGKIDIIASAVAYMAGYNIRLLPIIQSMAQMDVTYGKDVARAIITNHALQIIYAPREQQDANDYSDMLGYTTVRKQNLTRGREFSRNESEERRALMLPQELKAMRDDKEVFLCEGIPHPVMCDKIRYYKDRYFTSRLLAKVGVSPLKF
jgi:type IV secretion system protein VirD4